MNTLKKILAKELSSSNGNTTLIHGNYMGNIHPINEYIKWLSYEPEFEKERYRELGNKLAKDLSLEELQELQKLRIHKELAELFKQYGEQKLSKENYLRVYNFMHGESIEEIMLSKLTLEELRDAKKDLEDLEHLPKEEINNKIKEEKEPTTYSTLSMKDAYVLHCLCDFNFNLSLRQLDKEIMSQIHRNNIIRQKSLFNANK